jgi:hypothetical protein
VTVHLKQDEIAAFNRTAEATLTPAATVAPAASVSTSTNCPAGPGKVASPLVVYELLEVVFAVAVEREP